MAVGTCLDLAWIYVAISLVVWVELTSNKNKKKRCQGNEDASRREGTPHLSGCHLPAVFSHGFSCSFRKQWVMTVLSQTR